MREYFWGEYYKNGEVVPFRKTLDYSGLEIVVTSKDADNCVIEMKQRGECAKLEMKRGECCFLNGMNTGKVCFYDDIESSMEYDEFGGIKLILNDGDYMSMRMDGLITSFFGIPFGKLDTHITPYVSRVKSQYRGDWYNTLQR